MKRRGANKLATFWEPVYKTSFYFWHAPESRMLARVREHGHAMEEHDGAGRMLSYRHLGRLVVHVWIRPDYDLSDADVVANVAHECLHAALEVFEAIGVKDVDGASQEALAYYVEMLVREYLRRMR